MRKGPLGADEEVGYPLYGLEGTMVVQDLKVCGGVNVLRKNG